MKTLRRKTTTAEKRNRTMNELTPEKMEKIINTWATIRATNPKRITPRDSKLFNALKSKYITFLQKKPFHNIQFEKKFPHILNKKSSIKDESVFLDYLKKLEKEDKEQYKKLLLKILKQ